MDQVFSIRSLQSCICLRKLQFLETEISLQSASRRQQNQNDKYLLRVYSVEILLVMDSGHVRNTQSTLSNKYEKLCISLAFIIKIYHDARPFECQIHYSVHKSHPLSPIPRQLDLVHILTPDSLRLILTLSFNLSVPSFPKCLMPSEFLYTTKSK